MDTKHYTEVLIDGRIFTLGGYEDEAYLQRVASYINEMITTMKRQEGFTKQSAEYQTAMVELNMADDYFKARERIIRLERQKAEMEKEIYSLKHELVSMQMRQEAANKEAVGKEAFENEAAVVPKTRPASLSGHGSLGRKRASSGMAGGGLTEDGNKEEFGGVS